MVVKKLIVRLRMWYAKMRGHKRWNYEPSKHYMKGRRK